MSSTIVELKRGLDVGRVLVKVEVANHDDHRAAGRGELAPEAIRRLTCEALVDSGATYICLPTRLIQQLGLTPERVRQIRTANGTVERTIYSQVVLDVEGRDCPAEVMELPDESPALLGQLPLEAMDLWIDTTNQRLVGNPEHDGEWQAEAY